MIKKAAEIIRNSEHVTAFTGAGISVESGIPPFRGENGLWSKYDPHLFDIDHFVNNPKKSWKLIKEIFFDTLADTKPNAAHITLAEMERKGYLQAIITQNIDNLHQKAGSKEVYEFHGNTRNLVCTGCSYKYKAVDFDFKDLPPQCEKCESPLKPDFIFFGEPIPETAMRKSFQETEKADLLILIGTTGEVMPASLIPYQSKRNGAKIVEVNIKPSNYTESITDIFLQGKATKTMQELIEIL
ncbi:MAG: NAD-dependent deacylase [Candidatus Cloacimonetes bacterium]|nr:NAD-dependent deacylase [Candidatus Cloacimonadota bacterium]MBS3768209.1 NAD-dependent deacylase [Candidatus Cloacimonadota bacterium]